MRQRPNSGSKKQNNQLKQADHIVKSAEKQLHDLGAYSRKVSETWAALEGLEIFEAKCTDMSEGDRVRQARSKMAAYQWFYQWLTGEKSRLQDLIC